MTLINILDCQILENTADYKNISDIRDKVLSQRDIAQQTLKTKISEVQKS